MKGDSGEKDEVLDFGEILDRKAEQILFGSNPNRVRALREIWFSEMIEAIDAVDAPEEGKRELLFMAVSNSILDMVMDIVPPEFALAFARNLDEYLKVALVNKEYGTDLMRRFQEDFVEERGTDFSTQEELDNAVEVFQEEWWNTAREELGGKSPNRVIKEIGNRYDL